MLKDGIHLSALPDLGASSSVVERWYNYEQVLRKVSIMSFLYFPLKQIVLSYCQKQDIMIDGQLVWSNWQFTFLYFLVTSKFSVLVLFFLFLWCTEEKRIMGPIFCMICLISKNRRGVCIRKCKLLEMCILRTDNRDHLFKTLYSIQGFLSRWEKHLILHQWCH